MIRKIEEKDKETFLHFTRDFYASDAVLHTIPDRYHTNVFEEILRSGQYAEGFLIEYEEIPAGYALIAKTYSHECGGFYRNLGFVPLDYKQMIKDRNYN